MISDLRFQIAWNWNIYQKKNEGATLNPPCSTEGNLQGGFNILDSRSVMCEFKGCPGSYYGGKKFMLSKVTIEIENEIIFFSKNFF